MLDKRYEPSQIETPIYEKWEAEGCFAPTGEGEPFTIVIPPPNVTGQLHMGHALNNTLQDILCRYQRMRGRDVLWQVGTDHAGIATQMVVERRLAEQGNQSRRELGREEFIKRVWEWKQESGDAITQQLRRLGASCDWSRERFTMDEGLSAEVVRVFVALHEEKLIYKDKRLVNWDSELLTAISDLEVEPREQNGNLWHFNYPLEDGGTITVATTRPETMLGDTGIAVNPADDRYKNLVGKFAVLPLVGRRIPIVADDYADPEQGSGAVKITPAHDFNDFEVGRRCNLAAINILDEHGAIDLSGEEFSQMAGRDEWQGVDRFAARKMVVEKMEALGLLAQVEPTTHIVPFGDRSGTIIEPRLTDQWYVDAKTLAAPAIEAVDKEVTQFVPANWKKTYDEWMKNIQPWCISRQLWWGHRIPAWYTADGEVFVAENIEAAAAKAGIAKELLTQDEDVLDTWFSSALWAFSTLEEDEQATRYPTQVLVTGFDIIFFWVARMMMMGIYNMDKKFPFVEDETLTPEENRIERLKKIVPFKEVYVHALVRDAKGAKMSKSKGNVIDPLELIDKYGADALRFTLAAMASPGRDIKLSEQRVEGYRNFGTKLWNAARFCEMNGCFEEGVAEFDPKSVSHPFAKWLISEIVFTSEKIARQLENYRFDLAATEIYKFIWNDFCDFYIEIVKFRFQNDTDEAKDELRLATNWCFTYILRMLHPFMPFVTEGIWQEISQDDSDVMLADWLELDESDIKSYEGDHSDVEWLKIVSHDIKSRKSLLDIPATEKKLLKIKGIGPNIFDRLMKFRDDVEKLTNVSVPELNKENDWADNYFIYTLGVNADDIQKLNKKYLKQYNIAEKLRKELSNKKSISRIPEHVIEKKRADQMSALLEVRNIQREIHEHNEEAAKSKTS